MIETTTPRKRRVLPGFWKRILIFLTIFGPATITAMADNDAGGVATYSLAGAKLGYPILFPLVIITILLGVTQEMGMRLTVITRKGLADLIREKFGVKVAIFMFGALLIANIGTLITEIAAIKTTSTMLHIPPIPFVMVIVLVSLFFVTKGNYKLTQGIMLVASLFYIVYIISAVKAHPDWGLAVTNLLYPHGVDMTSAYMRDFLLIGMGVLGTTITPWGQFFISSFAFDKKIEKGKINYSQMETYWGAFLTDFFSFFMIVATAATLYIHAIPLVSGEQAAEFFGISGSLNDSYQKSKTFYILFVIQLIVAMAIALFIPLSLFKVAVFTQTINAVALPPVFYYLIKLTSDRQLMGEFANNKFQKIFSIACTVIIIVTSLFTVATIFIKT